MGNTYNIVQEQATLKWRLKFAQRVLRLELIGSKVNCITHVGDLAGDGKVIPFVRTR